MKRFGYNYHNLQTGSRNSREFDTKTELTHAINQSIKDNPDKLTYYDLYEKVPLAATLITSIKLERI